MDIATRRLLIKIRHQLKAMNCSAAHAASWVEPEVDATTKMLKRIDKHLGKNDPAWLHKIKTSAADGKRRMANHCARKMQMV